MSPLDWGQVFPRSWEVRRKTLELFEVKSRKNLQSFSAVFCEMQSDNPVIVFVSGPTHQTGHNSAVNETYRTVVDKEQIVGYFSDRRTTGVIMPSDGQQQLVLGGSEACDARLALAPAFEMAEPSPQGQQAGVDGIGQTHSCQDIILARYISLNLN